MGYRYWFGLPVRRPAVQPGERAPGYLIASAEDLTHYVIAQLNAGRYEDITILSPAGIAALQRPASATATANLVRHGLENQAGQWRAGDLA